MPNFTTRHLETLARGERVPPAVLRAIVADPDALRRLREQRLIMSIFQDEEPFVPIETDVTLQELDLHLSGQLADPARQAAVEELLEKEFPIKGEGDRSVTSPQVANATNESWPTDPSGATVTPTATPNSP